MVVILAVRHFVGTDWQPTEMGFQSLVPTNGLAHERFPDTRLLASQPAAFVLVPQSLLPLPNREHETQSFHSTSPAPPATGIDSNPDLAASMKLLLRGYLAADNRLSLPQAAEIVGLSARGLQRRLARAGLTYRDLLAEVRFEVAIRLMVQEPVAPIADIAQVAGYEDPSHFTRAFRRFTGVSPREYRKTRMRKS
jgi:AraC-like DNA-binding protein